MCDDTVFRKVFSAFIHWFIYFGSADVPVYSLTVWLTDHLVDTQDQEAARLQAEMDVICNERDRLVAICEQQDA